MTEHDPPTHRKRPVGRPPALTVDQVVDAAIDLADEDGLDGLSMPKLASSLGVGTMTLYGYVANKHQLLDLMAARIFADLSIGDHDEPLLRLYAYFHDFRQAALAHPALARLLAAGRVTIPAVFDTLEAALGPMVGTGVSGEEAVRTFFAALAYTLGFVLWEIPRARLQPEREYEIQWRDLIADLDPERHPTLTGPAADVLPSTSSEEQFAWGLERVLGRPIRPRPSPD